MSDKIVVPGAEALKGTMSDGIELPFPACFFYVMNGNMAYKKDGGALYFGGWAVDKETADATIRPFPPELIVAELANREGKEYQVYTVRQLYLAAIAKRKRWHAEPGMKPRSHVQVLGMVAVKGVVNEKPALIPIGAHVLTAKGWQAANLEEAFSAWEKQSAHARREVAGNAPANYFYAGIGTFGKEPNIKQVGSGTTSPITPIGVEPTPEVKPAQLLNRYVGDDVAADMNRMKVEAAEWLSAWNEPETQKTVAAADDFPMPEEPPVEEFDLL